MKLLVDVHHSRLGAEGLRGAGYAVRAASDDSVLATLPDDELLRAATRDGRALVTENVADFDRLVRAFAAAGEHHAGVVFSSPRRFHRASTAYPGNLVTALAALFEDPPIEQFDWVHWLT